MFSLKAYSLGEKVISTIGIKNRLTAAGGLLLLGVENVADCSDRDYNSDLRVIRRPLNSSLCLAGVGFSGCPRDNL